MKLGVKVLHSSGICPTPPPKKQSVPSAGSCILPHCGASLQIQTQISSCCTEESLHSEVIVIHTPNDMCHTKSCVASWTWWYKSIVSALGRQQQQNQKFKANSNHVTKSQASLGYSPPQKNKGEEGAHFSLYVSCVSNFNLYMNHQGPYELNEIFIHHMWGEAVSSRPAWQAFKALAIERSQFTHPDPTKH